MTEYVVRSMDPSTLVIESTPVVATGEKEAQAVLLARGRVVLSVARSASIQMPWQRTKRLKNSDYALFCRELETLTRAGMTVVEAVDTLSAKETSHDRADGIAAALLVRLQEGHALSVALSDVGEAPPVLVAAVRAGERTSNLKEALADYLRFDGLVERLRRKAVSSAIYPAIVLALGIAISVFLLLVVLPNFSRMYQSLRGTASGATALMINFSQWLSENRALALGLFCALLITLLLAAINGWLTRLAVGLAHSVPAVWRRIQDFQLAMTYQAIALMLKGGYSMMDALNVAAQSALSADVRDSLAKATRQVEKGGRLSQALHAEGLADEVSRRLMAAAEKNGDFHLAADLVSRLYAERFELFVDRVMRIAEPLLLMLVALVVGGIVVMMYMPVFDMATRLR